MAASPASTCEFSDKQCGNAQALHDRFGKAVGWALEHILKDGIIPRLKGYIKANPEVALKQAVAGGAWRVKYKVGSDNFSYSMFDKDIANEQTGLLLLLPGLEANSYRNMLPLAFCFNQKETPELVAAINAHVDGQLANLKPFHVIVGGYRYKFELEVRSLLSCRTCRMRERMDIWLRAACRACAGIP